VRSCAGGFPVVVIEVECSCSCCEWLPPQVGDDVYICSSHQFDLLKDACGARIVDRGIDSDLFALLSSGAVLAACNLVTMSPEHVAGLLPTIVAAEWRVQREVLWCPGAPGHLTVDWLSRLWAYVNAECPSLAPFAECSIPILPTTSGTLLALVPASVSVAMDDTGMEEPLLKVRACGEEAASLVVYSHSLM
jgi:hypothetical protein